MKVNKRAKNNNTVSYVMIPIHFICLKTDFSLQPVMAQHKFSDHQSTFNIKAAFLKKDVSDKS